MAVKTVDWDFELHYSRKVAPLRPEAPWVLRITDLSGKPSPVFVMKQRRTVPLEPSRNGQSKKPKKKRQEEGSLFGEAPAGEKVILQERGLIYGDAQRRCLPVLREIVSRVQDSHHVGLELQRLLPDRIQFRGNLPLDDEAGCKLTLIFKLQERVKELDRVELIARRVERFTREEAAYWLSRISNFGDDANRWAVSGLKVVLGGQPKDKGVDRMLEQLRSSK